MMSSTRANHHEIWLQTSPRRRSVIRASSSSQFPYILSSSSVSTTLSMYKHICPRLRSVHPVLTKINFYRPHVTETFLEMLLSLSSRMALISFRLSFSVIRYVNITRHIRWFYCISNMNFVIRLFVVL